MGNRLTSLLAIFYMGRLERNAINRDTKCHLHKGYTDDILIIAKFRRVMEEIFHNLHSDAICLSRCAVVIRIRDEAFETEWYTKPTSKNLLLNTGPHTFWL